MKRFLVLLFLSYVSSDKLDLTYLPPPGSQYAGGRPEDIQTPLEYPKQSYSTTQRPSTVTFGQKVQSPDDYQATIGIDRIPPSLNQAGFPPQGSRAPNYQSSNNVPTTTVSYAFTQTTTHPPTDSFETTISPINPITGLPTNAPFNVPSEIADQIYRGNNNQFQPNKPGNQQYNRVPGQTIPGPIAQFPGSSIPSSNQFYGEQNPPGQTQYQQSFQQSNAGRRPGFVTETPSLQTQYPRNQTLIRGNNRQPGFISSTNAPQGTSSGYYPSTTAYPDTDNVLGFTTTRPDQAGINNLPNAYQPDTKIGSQNTYPTSSNKVAQQQYPGYPSSTITPTISAPGLGSQQTISGDYSSPVNFQGTNKGPYDTKSGNFPSSDKFGDANRGTFDTNAYGTRPERPQAEGDRNAVIFNYKNVITPEGFEYSFDTSNGIHADENGTAIDGVKAEGSYSYTGDDGNVYTVVYTADENGFRPRGSHLPTPPPIPEAIQRVIEKANRDKEAGIIDDGSYDEGKYGYNKYQEIGSHYPQYLDKTAPGDVRLSQLGDKYSPSREQSLKNKISASQPGLKTTNDFDDYSESQEQYEDDQLAEDDVEPNNKKTPSGSRNRISSNFEQTSEQYSRKPITDAKISRRPVTNTGSIQNQEEDYENDQRVSDIQRPSNAKVPSSTQYPSDKDQEYFDELSIEDKNIPGENGSYKGDSQRPQSQQKQRFMGADRIRKPGSSLNQDTYERNKQQIVDKPVSGMIQNNKATSDLLKNGRRPVYHLPSRQPTSQSVTDEDDLENTDVYNPNKYREDDRTNIRNKPDRFPSNYPAKTNELTTVEDYTSSSEIPTRSQPSGINKPGLNMLTEQRLSTRRRPSRPGFKVDYINPDVIDNDSDEYVTEGDVTLTDSFTTPATRDRIEVSQDLNPQIDQQYVTNRPKSFTTKYSSSRDKLQRPTYNNERNGEEINENVKYGQRLRGKPATSANVSTGNIQESNNKVFNSTGYQYIPPRNRFNFDEGNNYSNLGQGFSTTRKPSQQLIEYNRKDATAKPFITPNVSRVDSESPEDYNENVRINDERRPNQQRYNEKSNVDDYEQYTTPDQSFSGEVISSGRPSIQSTLGPFSQTTRRPQYNQQYSTTPHYETTPEGTVPSFQQKYDRNGSNTRRPYETSSLSPVASRRPSYDNTTPEGILIPGQKNVYYEATRNQMRPINVIVSPTSPSESSSYSGVSDGSYPNGNIENQYQTTYQTNGPTTATYDEITGQPIIEATRIVQSGPANQPPSTTYRPNYTIKGTEGSRRPIVQLDNFGRPIANSDGQGFQQQYRPTTPVYDKITGQPVTEDIRIVQSGPEASQNQYANQPPSTTTYRPNYTIKGTNDSRRPILQLDNFGRPIVSSNSQYLQQQYRPTTPSYDKVTGQPITEATRIVQSGPKGTQNLYENQPPSTTYRPNYTLKGTNGSRRPISELDDFGRPITSSEGQDFQRQYSQNPDGRSPLDNQNTSYQYTGKEQNYPGSGQGQRVPGYQTSTERIIGEDFSGPKQQQRFDPKLGYYY